MTIPNRRSALVNLELRHLVALDAVVSEGTFGRAAARLRYTQSAVSQQIAGLEKAVGGAVFDRPGGPRTVRLTPLGRVVLAHGRQVLTEVSAAAEAIDRFRAGDGRIDIGTFQSVSTTILPAVVRRLRDEHPDVDIRVVEEESERPDPERYDVLFFDGRLAGGHEHLTVLHDPYVLVARRGDFPDGPVSLADLHGVAMVAHPPICDLARVDRLFAEAGIEPLTVFRTADNTALVAMVRAGMGPAVLPRLAVELQPDDVLHLHPLRPTIPPREINLVLPTGRTLSPLAERVISLATEVAAGLAPGLGADLPFAEPTCFVSPGAGSPPRSGRRRSP